MMLRWPKFWTDPHPPSLWWRWLLVPLSWVVIWAGRWRWRWATPYHVGRPIICIGNFTIGGAGKTPMTILCARRFQNQACAILSRGYGAQLSYRRVLPKSHTARQVGDEPLLMAKEAPVYIGKDRRHCARLAIDDGAAILVLDDGLQNPHLVHQCNIAVVDEAIGLGNGYVLPAGPLRRPWMDDLHHTHALLILKRSPRHASLRPLLQKARARRLPVFTATRRLLPNGLSKKQSVFAFCGLACPDKFFSSLRQSGFSLAGTRAFPDHYHFSPRDAKWLLAQARKHQAQLVTTQKDAMRLNTPQLKTLKDQTHSMNERIILHEAAAFWRFVQKRLTL